MALSSIESFMVRTCEIDANRRMTLPALVNLMQEVAWNNSADLGGSVYDLQKLGITWVLTRLRIELDHLPAHGEEIHIETWPSGHERVFVYRDYRLFDQHQHLIGKATSTWLVLDMESRKMTRLPEAFIPRVQAPIGKTAMARASQKLPARPDDLPGNPIRVRWHHLDPNGHAYNGHFFRWLLDPIPTPVLKNQLPRAFDISIRGEAVQGDELRAACWPVESGYGHVLWNLNGKTMAIAQSSWE